VDWVALASLRDVTNVFRDMKSPEHQIAGMTTSRDMADWFAQTRWFPGGVRNASHTTRQYFKNLLEVNQRVNSHVCLLIRNSIAAPSAFEVGIDKFRKGTPKTWHFFPDHWVVLKCRITIDCRPPPPPSMINAQQIEELKNKPLNFGFWQWGHEYHDWINHRFRNITAAKFLPYYYGYVSATR